MTIEKFRPHLKTNNVYCRCGKKAENFTTEIYKDWIMRTAQDCKCGRPGKCIAVPIDSTANQKWIGKLNNLKEKMGIVNDK